MTITLRAFCRTYVPLLLLALLPVAVMGVGRPGDDLPFHVSSWMEMLASWRSGVLFPAWGAHANFNLGEPRLYFYPPLSLMLGAVLLAVVPKLVIAQVYVWVVMVLMGLSMLALAKDLLPERDRVKAAAMYMTSYYVLIMALLRFSAAELLTAALLPVVVKFYLRLVRSPAGSEPAAAVGAAPSRSTLFRPAAGLTVALAGTWLVDAPAALVVFYVLLLCTFIQAILQHTLRVLLLFAAAETGALLLSAWYLLPALLARRQIQASALLGYRWSDTLLFRAPAKGLTPAMHLPLSAWALAGTAAVVLLAASSSTRNPTRNSTRNSGPPSSPTSAETQRCLSLLCCMACVALFCQLPVSAPLWRFLPQFSYIQFGFRFDVFLGCVLPLALLLGMPSRRSRSYVVAVWAIFCLVPLASRVAQQHSRAGWVTASQFIAKVPDGYAGSGEFATAGMPRQPIDLGGQTIRSTVPAGPTGNLCRADATLWASERREFESQSSSQSPSSERVSQGVSQRLNAPCSYRVALAYYPDWHLTIDGVEADSLAPGADGLVRVTVPAGRHFVSLRFMRPRIPGLAGGAISALALILVGGAWLYDPKLSGRKLRDHKPRGNNRPTQAIRTSASLPGRAWQRGWPEAFRRRPRPAPMSSGQ